MLEYRGNKVARGARMASTSSTSGNDSSGKAVIGLDCAREGYRNGRG